MSVALRPGVRRQESCYRCCRRSRRTTEHIYLFSENGRHPEVAYWRCKCGEILISMGDVHDSEGLVRAVLAEKLREAGRWTPTDLEDRAAPGDQPASVRLDYEDALGRLRAEIFVAWTKYDPARGLTFTSYGTWWCRSRLKDWFKKELRRGDQTNPHAIAVSLDQRGPEDSDREIVDTGPADGYIGAGRAPLERRGADPLGATLDPLSLDGAEHSLADLRRVLVRRRRAIAREGRRLGVGSDARPPSRDRQPDVELTG